jgi:hypothetical protein
MPAATASIAAYFSINTGDVSIFAQNEVPASHRKAMTMQVNSVMTNV